VAPSTVQGDGTDWHLGYYAALCVLYARAIYLELGAGESAIAEGPGYARLLTVAVVYAMLLPVLGLQEKAGCLMFSQLRLHGGSNHFILPTSLLPRVLLNAPATSAFAGGVVRIEATNLTWVGNTFAEHMGPRTLHLVREVAAVPGEYVWAAKSTSARRDTPPPRFRPHTLSALGLRRLLETASKQGDAFWLRYTRLHGATGDEVWRTSSSGVQYIVRSPGSGVPRVCVEQRGSGAACMLGGCEVDCDQRELSLLDPPGQLSSMLAYFLVPQPNPIVPGYLDEMHCVTWG